MFNVKSLIVSSMTNILANMWSATKTRTIKCLRASIFYGFILIKNTTYSYLLRIHCVGSWAVLLCAVYSVICCMRFSHGLLLFSFLANKINFINLVYNLPTNQMIDLVLRFRFHISYDKTHWYSFRERNLRNLVDGRGDINK